MALVGKNMAYPRSLEDALQKPQVEQAGIS